MTQIDAEQKPVTKRGFIRTWLLAQLAFLVVAAVWFAFLTMVGKGYSVTHLVLFGLCVFPPASFLALWGVRAALGGKFAKLVFFVLSAAAIATTIWFSDLAAALMISLSWLAVAVPFFFITKLIMLIKNIDNAFAARRADRAKPRVFADEEGADEYVWFNHVDQSDSNVALKELNKTFQYVEQQMLHESEPTLPRPIRF
ncbi:hypothetical protein VPH49_25575 [Pseudomonas luteola]|uniref:hypothetical protein n=1 Tax=Pseudomonas TaxID=286 RepID=UPI000F7844F8|nr:MULTISPECIES: hypothetical protein [Pseudomonas]QEU26291.1 hypothetical protein FOB45_00245 [Pseudomonas luteola]RRW43150.1 hypothetical protein EGJ50_19170 [Pseudomonas luteola]